MLYIDVKRKMLLLIAGKAVEECKIGVMDNGVYAWTAKGGVGGEPPLTLMRFLLL